MHSCTIAILDGLGGPELLVIAVVALLLFGSKRMPEIGRGVGRAIREFKRATSGVEENIREVLYEEPARPKLRPPAHRRPHRDVTAHASASDATPPPSPTSAPRSEADFNEPAPLESGAEDSTRPGTSAPEASPRDNDAAGRG
ncbi:MAG: twin-arginine translocase TatA/TatE family subunit [Opitutaceae bacterium]|nr:twin-arginine translocase TatA/TatE family subunit [Opitutaceae bacterium]